MKKNIFNSGKKEFNLLDAGMGEFIYIIVMLIIIELFKIAIRIGLPYNDFVSGLVSFCVELGFVGTVLIVGALNKSNVIKATKINSKPKSNHMWFCVLIALIAYFGFSALTNTFIEFLDLIGYKSSSSGINVDSWWKYLLYTITMAAVPAFCEELLFRGVVYQGLRKWSKVGAIFISAALFMLMHGSPDQTVHQFVIGIILAVVFSVTGSIWCPMLIHFLNNFIALTLSFVVTMIQKSAQVQNSESANQVVVGPWESWAIGLFSALFSAIVAGLLIWVIVKHLQKNKIEQNNNQTSNENVISEVESQEANQSKEEFSDKGKVTAIVFFVLATIWGCFDWIQALVIGLLK